MKTSEGKNLRVFLKINQAGVFKHFKANIKYYKKNHPGAGSNLSLKAYFAGYFKFFSRPLQRAPGWYILLILHKINVAKFHRMKTSGGKNIRVFLKIDQAGVFKHFKAHIKYNWKKLNPGAGSKISQKAYFARYYKKISRPLQRAPGWYILLNMHKINVTKFHTMKTSEGKNIRVFLKINQAGVFKHCKAHI